MEPSEATFFTEREAAPLSAACELAPEAQSLLEPGMSAAALYGALLSADRPFDAVRLLAHALPPRDAVFWAWQCAVQAAGAAPAAEELDALEAIREWFMDPTDERRHRAGDLAEAAGAGTPAGCCGQAAFLSGGSIAPLGMDGVEAPEGVYPRSVTGAVLLACLSIRPDDPPGAALEFLQAWWTVAGEPRPWDSPEERAPDAPGYNPDARFN